MSYVKILVVENEQIISMQICSFLENIGYQVLPPVTNYKEAVVLLHGEKPDIAILDIELDGDKTGLDVAKYIKEHNNIPFIFLTIKANRETIEQAKLLNPPAYLVKPFKKEDLFTSVELALYNFHNAQKEKHGSIEEVSSKDAIYIKDHYSFRKLTFSEIVFAKSDHVYIQITKTDGERKLIRSTIKKFSDLLPANFKQIHRSYIINLDYLESFDFPKAVVKGHEIPVSRSFKETLTVFLKGK
jgi:DNA-binding LytR/AlgR family response regulator